VYHRREASADQWSEVAGSLVHSSMRQMKKSWLDKRERKTRADA